MIDALTTEPHFLDHLAPVWHALADDGGTFYAPGLTRRAAGHGISAVDSLPPANGRPTLAAAYGDMKRARKVGRPVVMMEHGAGQTYAGTTSGSYLSSPDREGVIGVLVPGEHQAGVHRAAHPDIPVVVVGSPKLDAWHDTPRHPGAPTIAISFHWECTLVPETRSAWRHYHRALPTITAQHDRVIGHGHPRMIRHLAPAYVRHGLDVVQRFDDILAGADLYICDNSSTLFEFASTGRPVIVLNAPWYRRNIHHGLRFWSHADVGIQVDSPAHLYAAIDLALTDPPEVAERRATIVDDIYAHRDGTSARRAADAARNLIDQEVAA